MRLIRIGLWALGLCVAGSCQPEKPPPGMALLPARPLVWNDSLLGLPEPVRRLSNAMLPVLPDSMLQVAFEAPMWAALYEQARYLKRRDVDIYPLKGLNKYEMLETVHLLQAAALSGPGALLQYFDYYQINTELKSDKVRITGYYTPTIKAGRQQSAEYPTPMLKMPEQGTPSPAAIRAGAMGGRDLELAWIGGERQLANAQLQGSCMVEFPDGDRDFLGFGGSVRGDGGVYVFFKKLDKNVIGSGNFPLTAGYSAAIDPRFIPIGATLLAELPVCDKMGNVIDHQYRVIFAQDRGGAIKTTKRMDLYCGIGKQGLEAAKRVNSYGRLWLMLPKREIRMIRR